MLKGLILWTRDQITYPATPLTRDQITSPATPLIRDQITSPDPPLRRDQITAPDPPLTRYIYPTIIHYVDNLEVQLNIAHP